jgi:hypothetical protein
MGRMVDPAADAVALPDNGPFLSIGGSLSPFGCRRRGWPRRSPAGARRPGVCGQGGERAVQPPGRPSERIVGELVRRVGGGVVVGVAMERRVRDHHRRIARAPERPMVAAPGDARDPAERRRMLQREIRGGAECGDQPARGREGLRPLAGRRLPAPGPGAGLVRVRRPPVRGVSGKVGTVDFIDASKAYFFPVGVPGLFRQYNAPADLPSVKPPKRCAAG